MVWQNFMLKWLWCGSEGSYDDFYLWEIKDIKNVLTADYICKDLMATMQQRWVYWL